MPSLAQLAQRLDGAGPRHEAMAHVVEPDRADLVHRRPPARPPRRATVADRREVAVRLRGTTARGSRARRARRPLSTMRARPPRIPVDQRLPEIEDHARAFAEPTPLRLRSTSHARRTSASVVRPLPIASRIASCPRSRVAATKSSPVAVAARASSKLSRSAVPEAHGRERMRRDHLPARLGLDPRREELREPDVLADHACSPSAPYHAQHEPQLQRAEPAAERRAEVLQVDGVTRSRRGSRATCRTSPAAPPAGATRTPSSPSA